MLLAYAAMRLVNHALGLYSIQAAEGMLRIDVAVWFSLPVTVLLYGAAVINIALAFMALYEHRTLRMSPIEAVRYALGFAVPVFLIAHVFGTRVAAGAGATPSYERIVWAMVQNDVEWRQLVLVTIVWIHAMIGLTLWLRHRDWFARWSHAMLVVACLVPLLGMLGFLSMARELTLRADEPDAITAQAGYAAEVDDAARTHRGPARRLGSTAISCCSRWCSVHASCAASSRRGDAGPPRCAPRRPRSRCRAASPCWRRAGRTASRTSRFCGGRGRCLTCRVRVAPARGLPPPKADEQATLASIRAPADVRLACQLRPQDDASIWPVFAMDGSQSPTGRGSVEREIVVLFTDLRRWTGLAERQLPIDLVHVQNEFYAAVGDAVAAAGGLPNQFVGDSVMAIFGLEIEHSEACRQAIAAVAGIEARMREVNKRMSRQFSHELDFGVGLHVGAAVVGYRENRTVLAVGDTVNIAARLQELTKAYGARLVLSDEVATRAALDLAGVAAHEIEVRGRQAPLTVYALPALGSPAVAARVPV